MGWERRRRGGVYYTRSKKVRGKVRREYVGGGLAGEQAAYIDHQHRAERKANTRAWRTEQARIEGAERKLERLTLISTEVTSALLQLAGYRQHNRGEWRRKREFIRSRGR
jgi:hypothetical protein